MTSAITARDLQRHYRDKKALDGVDLDVGTGRIVGILGPNGAGKTTLLKAILGLTGFTGELSVLGLDPRTARDKLMQEVCFVADVATLPRWISVREVAHFVEGVHARFDRGRFDRFIAGTQLTPSMRVREMSKGMVAQLHLALVMAIDARLLVLDEPTLGLDILSRRHFYQRLLEDYFDANKTIVIATHQIEEIEHILSDVIFLRAGKAVLTASLDEIAERFVELQVSSQNAEAARALHPFHERALPFGMAAMLFDKVPHHAISPLGNVRTPGLADVFAATMEGPGA